MRKRTIAVSLALIALPLTALAQVTGDSSSAIGTNLNPGQTQVVASPKAASAPDANSLPFSRFALGGGFSALGFNLIAATNLNPYLGLRCNGRFLRYTASSISASGFNISPKLDLASAGISLDYYPFPRHGFRLSPGLLFYNDNGASSRIVAVGGTSFTLNNQDYYSSTSNPVTGRADLNLHAQSPAFTITTGWGNFIPAKGGHWSFPFEIGIALTGKPKLYMQLTSGQTCDSTGLHCMNVISNQQLQSNLKAQAAKYDKDLEPLQTFPIIAGGIVYNFRIRGR